MSNHDPISALRETDQWLRRVAIYVPIMSFIVGWGTGVISTFLIFKDHEKRLIGLEVGQVDQNKIIETMHNRQNQVIAFLETKFNFKFQKE